MTSTFTIWNKAISSEDEKQQVASKIASYLNEGDIVGVGSGSSSYLALLALAKTQKKFKAVPTSLEIEYLCHIHKIETTNEPADWCFDGADEVDPNGNMIKGRGGAMLREKEVMKTCKGPRFILIDESKKVKKLGEKFAIPLEVESRKIFAVETALKEKGFDQLTLRLAVNKDGPVITENGHVIIDVNTTKTDEDTLLSINGVIETGLFINFNPTLILPETDLER